MKNVYSQIGKMNHPFNNFVKINTLKGHLSSIYGLAAIPDSNQFLSVGGDGWLVRWDCMTDDGYLVAKTDAKLFCIVYDGYHSMVIAGDMAGYLYRIDLHSNKIINRIKAHQKAIFGLCMVGEWLFVASADGYLSRWSFQNLECDISIKISNEGLRCLAFDPESQCLFIGASDCHIYQFDIQSMDVKDKILQAHGSSIFSIFLIDNLLVSGGRDAHMKCWNTKTLLEVNSINAHWYTINKIIYSRKTNLIATASRDKTIRIWDGTSFTLIRSIDASKGGHMNSVNDICWMNDDKILISTGDDRTIQLWKM